MTRADRFEIHRFQPRRVFRNDSVPSPASRYVRSAHARHAINERPIFQEIYRAHFAYVWRTLARLGVRECELEDAAQEVFVVVYRRQDSFDASRPIKPWLAGIAHRVAIAERRRARHRREQLTDSPPAHAEQSTFPSPHQGVEAKQRRDRIRAALDTLDMDRRVVFVMSEMEEIPCTEIAEVLGIPTGTVYSRLRVARERFKAAIRRLRLRERDI